MQQGIAAPLMPLLLFHFPFVLTAALIPLFGYPLIYLPVHIVWLELVIHPTALFAFQQSASLKEGESKPLYDFFAKADAIVVVSVGLVMTAALRLFFIFGLGDNSNLGRARASVMAALMIWSAGLVCFFARLRTTAAIAIVSVTVLSAIALVQIPEMSRVLHLSPLRFSDWALATAGVGAVLLCLGIANKVVLKKSGRSAKIER